MRVLPSNILSSCAFAHLPKPHRLAHELAREAARGRLGDLQEEAAWRAAAEAAARAAAEEQAAAAAAAAAALAKAEAEKKKELIAAYRWLLGDLPALPPAFLYPANARLASHLPCYALCCVTS